MPPGGVATSSGVGWWPGGERWRTGGVATVSGVGVRPGDGRTRGGTKGLREDKEDGRRAWPTGWAGVASRCWWLVDWGFAGDRVQETRASGDGGGGRWG